MLRPRKRSGLSPRYFADLGRTTNIIAERRSHRLPRILLQRIFATAGLVSAATCLATIAEPASFEAWVADGSFLATAILAVASAATYQIPLLKISPTNPNERSSKALRFKTLFAWPRKNSSSKYTE